MKTNFKMNIKGVEISVGFEGSIKEFAGLNKAMIDSIKDCAELFSVENQSKVYKAMEYAIDRVPEIQKKVMIKNKELKDFEKLINKK